MLQELTREQSVLEFDQEVDIEAPIDQVYEGMLHRLSDGHRGPGDRELPLKLERWAGGRWFRDLGDGNGHLWGFVQSIKPPSLIEFFGPMFMSYPVSGHLIIRFTEVDDRTRLTFRHSAFGLLLEEHRIGVQQGWRHMLGALKEELAG